MSLFIFASGIHVNFFRSVQYFSGLHKTGHSRTGGSFFPQVDHLFSTICLSKKAMNHADFFTGSKVMAEKFTLCWLKVNFLAITFEPVVWCFWNFECEKICRIDDLFAKAVCRKQVIHLGEKRSTWARILCIVNSTRAPQFSIRLIFDVYFMPSHFD